MKKIQKNRQHTKPTIQVSLHHSKRHTRRIIKTTTKWNSLPKITITDNDIKEAIVDMTIMSALGPDGITASIIKEFADQFIFLIKNI